MLRTIIATFTLAVTLAATPAHAADKGPLDAFKTSHEAVIALVTKKADNLTIQKEVDTFLDYRWIMEQSLGGSKRYAKRCEPRCAEFEALLTRLIRENYLRRIHQADKGKVKYLDEDRRGDKAKVNTKVTYTKDGRTQDLKIAYVMAIENEQWVVRDIITEGVSLAKNYRFEFNKILRDEGIDGLIARLETKLNEVAKAD